MRRRIYRKKIYSKGAYRRKTYRKKTYRGRRRMRMSYTINKTILQPDTLYTKLVYNEILGRTPANFVDNYVFTINSPYDPNFTGVGSQPAGFDQYATLYNSYQCLGSAISVKIINYSNVSGIYYAINPQRDSTAILYQDAVEQPYNRRALCGTAGSINIKRLSNFMRLKKLVGRETADLQYSSAVTASPTALYYWMLSFFSSDGSTNLTYTMEVQIKYYVKFFNRKPVLDT